jgi:hypothetical protein
LVVERTDVFPDNWIYIHSPEVQVGRIQNFKNWSPEMVPDASRTSLGLEYFVQEGDGLWTMSDEELRELGSREMGALGLLDGGKVVGHAVVRMPKAYPVYDRNYEGALATAREWLTQLDNLHLIGRNGQHRYNNQDHSMLTGMLAAQNVAGAAHDLWTASDDSSYLEEATRKTSRGDRAVPRRLETPAADAGFETLLASAFARYDPLALGGAVGLVAGLAVFLATAVLLLRGGEPIGPNLSLLSHYLIGFEVSWPGAVLGACEAVLLGFAFGFGLARVVNFSVGVVADSVVRECQLEGLLDPLDGATPTGTPSGSGNSEA